MIVLSDFLHGQGQTRLPSSLLTGLSWASGVRQKAVVCAPALVVSWVVASFEDPRLAGIAMTHADDQRIPKMEKIERRALKVIADLVNHYSYQYSYEVERKVIDTTALSANATAVRLLAEHRLC